MQYANILRVRLTRINSTVYYAFFTYFQRITIHTKYICNDAKNVFGALIYTWYEVYIVHIYIVLPGREHLFQGTAVRPTVEYMCP